MKNVLKMLLGLSGSRSAAYVDTPIVYLLHDTFTGSAGALEAHDPTGEWYWDHWTDEGHTGSAWALDGNGGVSQTDYPTGGEGTRNYQTYILAASNEPLVKATFTSPATNQWITGVMVRRLNEGHYWAIRLNSTNNRLEIFEVISGSGAVRAFTAFTTAQNTQYTIEGECHGTTIIARIGATSCNYTSSNNQSEFYVGLYEAAILNGGHSTFTNFTVEHSPSAGPLAGRLFYAPGAESLLTEWDGEDNTGIADAQWDTDGFLAMTITTTPGNSGTRVQFHCDDEGQLFAVKAPHAYKNLPDKMWFTTYIWIPELIQRTGGFWMLQQFKQRAADTGTSPLVTFNLGWNGSAMVTEVNNNIDTDGSFNNLMPDLSTVNYVFPVGQWVRIDVYYHWSTIAGRYRLWMDNVELYDFQGIKTLCSLPDDGTWDAPQYFRDLSITHYSSGLNPETSTIYFTHSSVNVGDRLPDDYPEVTPE